MATNSRKYSIKDIENLTGIKAHTLRIWEKRYGIIEPDRTDTNIRYYDDTEVKKILSISILNNHGIKISKIARLKPEELHKQVIEISTKNDNYNIYVEKLLLATIDMNEDDFEDIFNESIRHFGFENSIVNIIYPFLQKIGVLWVTGNIHPAQEHFTSHLIRQKLMVEADKLPKAQNKQNTFILFLPEGELHELGLLFYNYLLRKLGYHVIYLGQSVPYKDLLEVAALRKCKWLFTFFVASDNNYSIQTYLNTLSSDFKKQKIFVSGNQIITNNLTLPENIVKITHISDFINLHPLRSDKHILK
jgi:DNA-binding transcriptional MerR regulator